MSIYATITFQLGEKTGVFLLVYLTRVLDTGGCHSPHMHLRFISKKQNGHNATTQETAAGIGCVRHGGQSEGLNLTVGASFRSQRISTAAPNGGSSPAH